MPNPWDRQRWNSQGGRYAVQHARVGQSSIAAPRHGASTPESDDSAKPSPAPAPPATYTSTKSLSQATTAITPSPNPAEPFSSCRLRTISQRRLESLRASGNHAAADIFERALMKANGIPIPVPPTVAEAQDAALDDTVSTSTAGSTEGGSINQQKHVSSVTSVKEDELANMDVVTPETLPATPPPPPSDNGLHKTPSKSSGANNSFRATKSDVADNSFHTVGNLDEEVPVLPVPPMSQEVSSPVATETGHEGATADTLGSFEGENFCNTWHDDTRSTSVLSETMIQPDVNADADNTSEPQDESDAQSSDGSDGSDHDHAELTDLSEHIKTIFDEDTMERSLSPIDQQGSFATPSISSPPSSANSTADAIDAAIQVVLHNTFDYSVSDESSSHLPKSDISADAFEEEAEAEGKAAEEILAASVALEEAKVDLGNGSSISSMRWAKSARKLGQSMKKSMSRAAGSLSSRIIDPSHDNDVDTSWSSRTPHPSHGDLGPSSTLPPLAPKQDTARASSELSDGIVPYHSSSLSVLSSARESDVSAAPSIRSIASSATPVAGIGTREVSNLWGLPPTPISSSDTESEDDRGDLEVAALDGAALILLSQQIPEGASDDEITGNALEGTLMSNKKDLDISHSSSIDIEIGSTGEVEVFNPKLSRVQEGDADSQRNSSKKEILFFLNDCNPWSGSSESKMKSRGGSLTTCRRCFCCNCNHQFKLWYLIFLIVPFLSVVIYLCYSFLVEA